MTSLLLQDGTVFAGEPFGARVDTDGEAVFATGMTGYELSMTDPSFRGQILCFSYPLIGNYGVPSEEHNAWGFPANFESTDIHVRGLIVSQVSDVGSHYAAVSSISSWMEHHNIPGITGIDTRALVQHLREKGVMLGRIIQDDSKVDGLKGKPIDDPNEQNLVADVSINEPVTYDPKDGGIEGGNGEGLTVVAYDCGMKLNILRSFLKRGIKVVRVPWNFDLSNYDGPIDGLFISNGPGDPKTCTATLGAIKHAIEHKLPTFGICLGNQLLSLAIGGDTYKLPYGHRSCNQPCIEIGDDGQPTDRCIITSQNHGFAVSDQLPAGWRVWFKNANDGSVEGIRHESGKFFSVQFHPEATPGPEDANYLFDEFVRTMKEL